MNKHQNGSENGTDIILSEKESEKKDTSTVKHTGNMSKSFGLQKWARRGSIFQKDFSEENFDSLPPSIYHLEFSPDSGFYLRKLYNDYYFPYKIYQLESPLLKRVEKTYKNTTGNLGMIFNGLKGTGKSVAAKLLCNMMKLPVIVISQNIDNCHLFVNSISQDIIVFTDEYEKVFEKDTDILTIMDGAMNSTSRRLFLLTTNTLHVNDNLIQRPGRIRYIKTFQDLTPEITEEVVNDCLKHKSFKNDVLKYISGLKMITIDIVKAVVQEVNIHKESPFVFNNIFNAKQLDSKFDVFLVNKKGDDIPLCKSVVTNFNKYDPNEEERYNNFCLEISNIGNFPIINSIDAETVEVEIYSGSVYASEFVFSKLNLINPNAEKILKKSRNKSLIVTLRIVDSYTYHYAYRNHYYDFM